MQDSRLNTTKFRLCVTCKIYKISEAVAPSMDFGWGAVVFLSHSTTTDARNISEKETEGITYLNRIIYKLKRSVVRNFRRRFRIRVYVFIFLGIISVYTLRRDVRGSIRWHVCWILMKTRYGRIVSIFGGRQTNEYTRVWCICGARVAGSEKKGLHSK